MGLVNFTRKTWTMKKNQSSFESHLFALREFALQKYSFALNLPAIKTKQYRRCKMKIAAEMKLIGQSIKGVKVLSPEAAGRRQVLKLVFCLMDSLF